jgi:ankyrin repeat protein/tRNA A-37 threonylcarbamoyl transferase component Bud32
VQICELGDDKGAADAIGALLQQPSASAPPSANASSTAAVGVDGSPAVADASQLKPSSAPGTVPGLSALQQAVHAGNATSVSVLLAADESRGQVNAADEHGWTPLHVAAHGGHADIASLLLAAGADATRVDHFGDTPLHVAVWNGHAAVGEVLATASGSAGAGWRRDRDGKSPLHVACELGHGALVGPLLRAGANATAADAAGAHALHYAAGSGCLPCIEQLRAAGAPVNATDGAGRAAVHWACARPLVGQLCNPFDIASRLEVGPFASQPRASPSADVHALSFAAAGGAAVAAVVLLLLFLRKLCGRCRVPAPPGAAGLGELQRRLDAVAAERDDAAAQAARLQADLHLARDQEQRTRAELQQAELRWAEHMQAPDAAQARIAALEAERHAAAADRDAMIRAHAAELAARESVIAGHVATIAVREATIASHVATIAGHVATIAGHVATITARDATITGLRRELDAARSGAAGGAGAAAAPAKPSLVDCELHADAVVIKRDFRGDRERLGSGSFGDVYAATFGDQPCVVKVPKLRAGTPLLPPELQAAFWAEVRTHFALRHPHIVVVHGGTIVPDPTTARAKELRMVMERCSGGTLEGRLHGGEGGAGAAPGTLKQRLAWATQVLSALAYLHARDIIHADLKPENLLLEDDSPAARVKLSDFGLAKQRADGTRTHASHVGIRGSYPYMDPQLLARESSRGDGGAGSPTGDAAGAGDVVVEPGSLRKASDVYSAGVLLWELVAAQRPYADALGGGDVLRITLPQLVAHVMAGGRPATPEQLAALAPAGIGALIGRMWASRAEDRPTAAAAGEELARLAAEVGDA